MRKSHFFIRLYTEICLAIFFIIIAIQLVPIRGWEFITIFSCLFATNSAVTAIRMWQTYRTILSLEKNLRQDKQEKQDD